VRGLDKPVGDPAHPDGASILADHYPAAYCGVLHRSPGQNGMRSVTDTEVITVAPDR
jgi:hypothetical protein